MKKLRLLTILAIVSVIFFAGCKKDEYKATVGVCPLVVSTIPADKAIDVPLSQIVSATFNEKMNPATITQESFTLSQGATPVSGTVSYTALSAAFAPASPLAPFTLYTGRVKTLAKDLMNNSLQTDYVWTFTTIPQIVLSSLPIAGGTTSGAGTFAQGSAVTVTAIPNAGYGFTNWTENGVIVSTNSSYPLTMAGNKALVANFSVQLTVALSSNPATGGTTIGAGSFAPGSSVTVTATPSTGYTFVNWTEGTNIASTNAIYTSSLTANRTLVANFVTSGFTLNVIAVNGTVVKNPVLASYITGAIVQLTATPSTGYTFTGWSGDATGLLNPLSVTMNANKNITANFELTGSGFTLNIIAVNGSVLKNPNALSYSSGASVVLTATPNTGYTFTGWSGDATGSINPLSVTMNANKNITANFALTSGFTLNVIANNGSVTKNPDMVSYTSGSSVILTARANSGYTFTGWTGDDLGSVNPLTVIMNRNKNITANFIADILPPTSPLAIDLGCAAPFGIIAGSTITSTGPSIINGNVALSPGSALIGFPPGVINGTQEITTPAAAAAMQCLTSAFIEGQGRSLNAISLPGQLGGLTLAPGLYSNSSTSGISGTGANGILTLDAQGDANAVWIFQIGSTLTTDPATSIVLAGGAKASNIFWIVGTSATLGTTSVFYGSILADQAITLRTGAVLNGRALARIAAVTLDASTITTP